MDCGEEEPNQQESGNNALLEQIKEDSQENAESTYHGSQGLAKFSARPKGPAGDGAPLKSDRNPQAVSAFRDSSARRDYDRPEERQPHRKRHAIAGEPISSKRPQPRQVVESYSMPSSPEVSQRPTKYQEPYDPSAALQALLAPRQREIDNEAMDQDASRE